MTILLLVMVRGCGTQAHEYVTGGGVILNQTAGA
jgi:hypothetical protein